MVSTIMKKALATELEEHPESDGQIWSRAYCTISMQSKWHVWLRLKTQLSSTLNSKCGPQAFIHMRTDNRQVEKTWKLVGRYCCFKLWNYYRSLWWNMIVSPVTSGHSFLWMLNSLVLSTTNQYHTVQSGNNKAYLDSARVKRSIIRKTILW